MKVNSVDEWLLLNLGFHLSTYILFSLLWIQYMDYLGLIKAPRFGWVIGAFALPSGFLATIELFSVITGNDFRPVEVIVALGGITIVVTANFVAAKLQRESKAF